MKRIIKPISIVLVLLVGSAISGYLRYRDMPVKWYDDQGKRVVVAVEKDFSIPIDPMSERKGIYHSGWAYRRGGVWNTGSVITI